MFKATSSDNYIYNVQACVQRGENQSESESVQHSALTPVIILSISTTGGVGVIYYNMASYGSMLMIRAATCPSLPSYYRITPNPDTVSGSLHACSGEETEANSGKRVLFSAALCRSLPPYLYHGQRR